MSEKPATLEELRAKIANLELQVLFMKKLFNGVADQSVQCEHLNIDHKYHCLDCSRDFSGEIMADKIDRAMERKKYGES